MVSATPVRHAIMQSVKAALRDPHPYGRKAMTLVSHKHDNYVLARRFGRTAVMFFPGYAFILGWPVRFSPLSSLSKTN